MEEIAKIAIKTIKYCFGLRSFSLGRNGYDALGKYNINNLDFLHNTNANIIIENNTLFDYSWELIRDSTGVNYNKKYNQFEKHIFHQIIDNDYVDDNYSNFIGELQKIFPTNWESMLKFYNDLIVAIVDDLNNSIWDERTKKANDSDSEYSSSNYDYDYNSD